MSDARKTDTVVLVSRPNPASDLTRWKIILRSSTGSYRRKATLDQQILQSCLVLDPLALRSCFRDYTRRDSLCMSVTEASR